MNILLANKNPSYLEITQKMLKLHNENYQVELVTSGKDCLEKVSANSYDLLLLDYDLPDINGLEVLIRIKQTHLDLPVVMMIDEGRDDIALNSMEVGASDYIMKVRGYLTALPFTVRKVTAGKKVPVKPPNSESDKSTEAYYILDKRGRFLSANKRMEEVTGYSEEELVELTLTDLIPREKEQDFHAWAKEMTDKEAKKPFQTDVLCKKGEKRTLEFYVIPMKSEAGDIVGYRGRARDVTHKVREGFPTDGRINQVRMIDEMVDAINSCFNEPMKTLLKRIAEVVCQLFKFKRATVALLDRRRRVFVKQAMVGYLSSNSIEKRAAEVPQEVIDQIFEDRFKVKVIYYNQDLRENRGYLSPGVPERRTQERRPSSQWHKRDLMLLNLTDRANKAFGYISLDDPVEGKIPTRDTFYNLELFGKLASLAIENFYRFASLERRSRRLKQVLVTSNIFKLYLSLGELLKEIVWAIKLSLDFNLVALCLISKATGELEIKAVACEDKIKLLQLRELKFPLRSFKNLIKEQYKRGKSYLIDQEEPAIRSFKNIYYGSRVDERGEKGWPYWALLLVPLKSRAGKIIGFLMVDDPLDCRMPRVETIRTLEILANQVAVAIDNRIMYAQIKKRLKDLEEGGESVDRVYYEDHSKAGLKKLVEKFLR